ncbi:hypothetical protein ACFOSS_12880 [Pseudaeromonas sharmana]|uniref:Uncharacterized protein n=1 Tax=Pseudaeromonas sharmana TaxID=328412 RepID=A0ABV8CR36_9GAMM
MLDVHGVIINECMKMIGDVGPLSQKKPLCRMGGVSDINVITQLWLNISLGIGLCRGVHVQRLMRRFELLNSSHTTTSITKMMFPE